MRTELAPHGTGGPGHVAAFLTPEDNARPKSVVTASGSKFSETATTAITSINKPVTVTVPPASETAPLSGQALPGSLG